MGLTSSPERRFREALAQAASLAPEIADAGPAAIAELIPDAAPLDKLTAVLATGREWRARERAAQASAESSARERRAAERRGLTRRFVWSGDPALLDELEKIGTADDLAEAKRQHRVLRDSAAPRCAALIEKLRQGRSSPSRALQDLRQMSTNAPADLVAETEAEIQRVASSRKAA